MNESPESSMSMQIEVSFIVPVYNAEDTILDCLASITSQGVDAIEILCVDDFSGDNSALVIQKEAVKDPRIKLIRHELNCGAPTARNNGIRRARGKYIAFVDADDRLFRDSISFLHRQAEHADVQAIKGMMLVTEDNNVLKPHPLNQTREWSKTNLLDCDEIQHLYQYQSYLFRTEVIKKNNVFFDDSLRNFQDPEFLSRLLPLCTRIDITLVPMYVRVIRQGSIVSSNWRYTNFDSLARGAHMSLKALTKQNQYGAARVMSRTFERWWYKLEAIPETLTKEECLEMYTKVYDFSQASIFPIYRFSFTKAGACHALRLIEQSKYERCYEIMTSSLKVKRLVPKPIAKLYDLSALLLDILIRRP